ncbi:hypothetical protein FOZ60_013395 [Perkinsus olseni]|uniref:Uncharacterized protein n=1 Tax=Perkinsus olseni TaxID=32597 RepID=A0A7J6P9U0_PEROL|nr:hypothetical protein FOZ60_013395 [Perkinsus olseni]
MTADSTTTQSVPGGHTSLPPPFGGVPSESIVEFLTRYGLCAKANGWDEQKACYKLSTCLIGRALQVYLSLDPMIQSSYNAVRVALLCRLITPPYQAAASLRDRVLQPGESVDTLLYELNKLYFEAHFVASNLALAPDKFPIFDDLIKSDTSDSYHRDMILKVLDALPPEISSRLRVMQFTKVDDLAYQARIELATQSYDSTRTSTTTTPDTTPTVSTISLSDEQQEVEELRGQVAALTEAVYAGRGPNRRQYGFNGRNGKNGQGQGGKGSSSKRWCIYHKTDSHWTSECKAIARLARERNGDSGNISNISTGNYPNGEGTSVSTGPSSSQVPSLDQEDSQ